MREDPAAAFLACWQLNPGRERRPGITAVLYTSAADKRGFTGLVKITGHLRGGRVRAPSQRATKDFSDSQG